MRALLGVATALALTGTALAQVPAQPRDPNMPDPKTTIPEKIETDVPPVTGSTETLSERLDRTDGVIRPREGAAPDMRVPAPVPNPGTTPVIPPPGTPGGNTTIDPK
jgi:hypothetical protein